MSAIVKLVGRRFGRLVVLRRAAENFGSFVGWVCKCDCGTEKALPSRRLLRGDVKSCGCYRREWAADRKRTHDQSETCLYNIWLGIKQRCYNVNNDAYERYGGSGVTMCARWLNSFQDFADDVGPRPDGKSIDRFPNLRGNYEPGNVRWATPKEQANNRRPRRWGKKPKVA